MKNKKLIIFDLDGTLTESKMPISAVMAQAIGDLAVKHKVAIISGCKYNQFENQFIKHILGPIFGSFSNAQNNLYLLPTSGAQLYLYSGARRTFLKEYDNDLGLRDKVIIWNAFWSAVKVTGVQPLDPPYGEIGEDRGSQITFSLCGQDAPLDVRKAWDPAAEKRSQLVGYMNNSNSLSSMLNLSNMFSIKLGGLTSIDVTKKGIDKAYGITRVLDFINTRPLNKDEKILKENILFVGDALFEGGNDHAVRSMHVDCLETSGPDETLKIIENLLKEVRNATF
jgi:phosphomannomutase